MPWPVMADISIHDDFTLAVDPCAFARKVGIDPDTKQAELLTSASRRTLVCCTRQWGKSTTAAIAVTHEAIFNPGSLSVIVSPSQQQSTELFRKIHGFWQQLPNAPAAEQETLTRMSLRNGSRIISLPGSEKTTRGYSAASLVVMDEASRVDDELLTAVRPMMATVKNARFIALTTPAGKRGWFYEAWMDGDGWQRITVTADKCPRISKEFLEEERQSLGATKFAQEYECQFIEDGESAFSLALIEAAMTMDFEPFFPPRAAP
jgi:Terminase large subunit, T4likevirus-type, N-terminal